MTDRRTTMAARVGASFNPLTRFQAGQSGGWYDPSDITSLWQDTGRTTQVTATGQSVAVMDDLSGNGNHLSQSTLSYRPTFSVTADGNCLSFQTLEWLSNANVDFGCANVVMGWVHGGGSDAWGGILTNTSDQGLDVDLAFLLQDPPTTLYGGQAAGGGLTGSSNIWMNRVQTTAITNGVTAVVSGNGSGHPATKLSFPNGTMVGMDRGDTARKSNFLLYGLLSVGSTAAEIMPASERLDAEDWMAAKMGMTL